ncbi:MAG: hypothetical protein ABJH04_08070 [Cyclobacteriaceae bacterium]
MTLIFENPDSSILDYFQIKKVESILNNGSIKLFEEDEEPVFKLNLVEEKITFTQSWVPSNRMVVRIVQMWPNTSFRIEFIEMEVLLVGCYTYSPEGGLIKKKINSAYLVKGIEILKSMDQILSCPGDIEELAPPNRELEPA